MQVYNGSTEHDLLILRWWTDSFNSGELELFTTDTAQTPYGFLKMFEEPNILAFETDDSQIIMAAWVEPFMNGAFYSLWIHPDHRRPVEPALAFINETYEAAFRVYPVLVGITKQQRLLDSHAKLGYNYVGHIPHVFGEEGAHILYLTEEQWRNAKE